MLTHQELYTKFSTAVESTAVYGCFMVVVGTVSLINYDER